MTKEEIINKYWVTPTDLLKSVPKMMQAYADQQSAEKDKRIKELEDVISKGEEWKEDKNFGVRLKASIDKRMKEAGIWDKLLKQSKRWDDYKEMERKFFDSMDDITLNHLQGVKPLPIPPSNKEVK